MPGDQLRILGLFFVNPKKAASLILDQGSVIFAAIAAIAITLAISVAASSLERVEMQLVQSRLAEMSPAEAQYQFAAAMKPFHRRYYASGFSSLFAMGAFFVPVAIIILTSLAHLGSAMTILFRDYMPALCGLLFAWTAAHVPVALFWYLGVVPISPGTPFVLYSQVLGLALFTGLAASRALHRHRRLGRRVRDSLSRLAPHRRRHRLLRLPRRTCRTCSSRRGSSTSSTSASPATWARSAADSARGRTSSDNWKPRPSIPTTPTPAINSASSTSSAATSPTPKPASARPLPSIPTRPNRSFNSAASLRQKPETAKEALQHLERAASINPKLANYEVWRELGAACLATGDAAEALAHLEPYIKAREYDAEGLVLLGQALRKVNRPQEAKAAFERAIEAARTAPAFRRGEVKQWERQARQELRS